MSDTNAITSNSRRFKINMLRKGSQLSWDFVVINHVSDDFVVEHGVSSFDSKLPESDLEVSSTVTSEKINPDVTSRIRRILVYLILTQIASLISSSLVFSLQELFRPIGNLLTIMVWIFLIKEVSASVVPILEWIRAISSRQEFVEFRGDITSSNIAVATKTAGASVHSSLFDKNILRAVLEQAEAQEKMGSASIVEAKTLKTDDDTNDSAS